MRCLWMLAALAVALPPLPGPAAELDRLFFTPDERAALDVARSKGRRNAVGTEENAEAPTAPAPEVVTYSGVVRRSDGSTTVWVNNRAMSSTEAARSPLTGRVRSDGSLTVRSPQSERAVSLKVGQSAEMLSGTIEEGYVRGPAQPPAPATEPGAGQPPVPSMTTKPPAGEPSRGTAPVSAAPAAAREQQERFEDAIRALREATAAQAARQTLAPGTAPQAPASASPPAQ